MRKSIWVALAATLALSSCFKTVEKPGDGLPANPVVFSEKVEEYEAQTRAMDGHPIENVPNQTNKGLIPIGKSFGVWAWSHDGATATKFTDLDNKSVTRAANDGEKAVYTYTPTATWPNTPLSFLAYYPHSGSADFAANGGMGTPTVATDGTTMTIPYTVPTIGEKHIDLMYARKGATSGYAPVELEFRHALSRMKFSARLDGFEAADKLRVTGIKLVGATLSGTLTVPNDTEVAATWALGNTKGDITVADGSGERPDHILDHNLDATMRSLITATGTNTTAGDLIVLPQAVEDLSLEISATLNSEECEPYIIPLTAAPEMVMNYIYNYRIVLTPQGATVYVEVIPWNEGMDENVEFDGQYFLRVNKSRFDFKSWESDKADGYKLEDILEIETDHPDGWKIENIEYCTYKNKAGTVFAAERYPINWITSPEVTEVPDKSGVKTGVSVRVKPNPAPAHWLKEAKFDVVAGNMTKKIHIYQAGGGYLAAPGVLGVGVESGKLTLGGSKEYKNSHVDFGAENEFGPIENETVYVAYFRWGSLIATTSAGGHESSFSSDDIVWVPAGFRGTATEKEAIDMARREVNGVFGNIPYSSNRTTWLLDLENGLGDPCTLVGEGWCLPVGYGDNGENGGWNGGTPFTSTVLADYFVDWGEAGPGLPAGIATDDWSMFLHHAGDRHSNGQVYNSQNHNMGFYTNYWSSTPSKQNTPRGYVMGFNESRVGGTNSVDMVVGNPIRCVPVPEPTLSAELSGGGLAKTTWYNAVIPLDIDVESTVAWYPRVRIDNGTLLSKEASAAYFSVSDGFGDRTIEFYPPVESKATKYTISFYSTDDPTGLNTDTTAKQIVINQKWGGENHVLYVDVAGDGGTLKIGRWGDPALPSLTRDNLLYFTFGGTVGFQYNNSRRYNSTKLAAPPTKNYEAPCYDEGVSVNISRDSYHNLANVQDGKGDPCRLVGMTPDQIRNMTTDEELYALEAALKAEGVGGWRMPTWEENEAFINPVHQGVLNSSFSVADTPYGYTWWFMVLNGDGNLNVGTLVEGLSLSLPSTGYIRPEGYEQPTEGRGSHYIAFRANTSQANGDSSGFRFRVPATGAKADTWGFTNTFAIAVRCVRPQ